MNFYEMSALKESLLTIRKLKIHQIVKYSINARESIDGISFKSNITQEESTKVLNTLNGLNPDQLSRYKIPQTKIKNLEKWKIKKGPFRSLDDLLEVDGFSENFLQNICDKIINENVDGDNPRELQVKAGSKRFKQLLTPSLDGLKEELNSATGVHLSPIGVSWARLSREENKLTNWNFEDFTELPKKMLPSDTFNQAINIVRRIPPSDVYIFESGTPMSLNSGSQTAAVSAHNQQLELTSMLLALLNTSVNHNVTLQNVNVEKPTPTYILNRVFFLKSRLPARLFRTLVGKEKVSALSIVNELVGNSSEQKFVLPCTPITVDRLLRNSFNFQESSDKELLGQALLLAVTFMDIFVLENPASLKVVSGSRANVK